MTEKTLREAAIMALEAIESGHTLKLTRAVVTLTAALAAPEAEPVAWEVIYTDLSGVAQKVVHGHNAIADYRVIDPAATSTPLFAAPQAAPVERKPLTDEEILAIGKAISNRVDAYDNGIEFARAIEKARSVHWLAEPKAVERAPLNSRRVKAIMESAINGKSEMGDMEYVGWIIEAVERAHNIK